jgi:hypothetical protein
MVKVKQATLGAAKLHLVKMTCKGMGVLVACHGIYFYRITVRETDKSIWGFETSVCACIVAFEVGSGEKAASRAPFGVQVHYTTSHAFNIRGGPQAKGQAVSQLPISNTGDVTPSGVLPEYWRNYH